MKILSERLILQTKAHERDVRVNEGAMWYFKTRVLDKVDINSASVEKVTYLINGGQNGIEDRRKKYKLAKKLNK